MRGFREAAAKAPCPVCGLERVLAEANGRCVRCSRRCTECGGPVRARDATVCRPCLRKAERDAAKARCPRWGQLGFLRAETGWCGTCSRPTPQKGPPRVCVVCGELRRHAALGMCSLCWQKNPDRAEVRGEHLIAELADPPLWVPDFVAFLAGRHCPTRAAMMVGIRARRGQCRPARKATKSGTHRGGSASSAIRCSPRTSARSGFFCQHREHIPCLLYT